MAKVIKPNKEFWESDKKPDFLEMSDTKDDDVKAVKFVGPKYRRKSANMIEKIGKTKK